MTRNQLELVYLTARWSFLGQLSRAAQEHAKWCKAMSRATGKVFK